MAGTYAWLVRFLHILSGVTMVGGVFLWSMVIMPSLQRRLPPHVRGPFLNVVFPRVSRYLTLAGILTIVTGFWTMGVIVDFGNIGTMFSNSPWGHALGAGLAAVVLMMIIALTIIQPSANRLLALGAAAAAQAPPVAVATVGGQAAAAAPTQAAVTAPASPPPEVAALQKRLAIAGMVNVLLAVASLALMAYAVNLRA